MGAVKQHFQIIWLETSASHLAALAAIRQALQVGPPPPETFADRLLCLTGEDPLLCPIYGQGRLHKTDRRLFPDRGQPP